MGTITGERRSSQASASWDGVAPPCDLAISSSGPPGSASWPLLTGAQGMNAMPCVSQ